MTNISLTPDPPSKLTGKMHAVAVRWSISNSTWIEIGPTPKLILAIRARRDVELKTLKIDFPDLGPGGSNHPIVGKAESVLVQVPHVVGLRKLRPQHEPWVWGQENVLASAMFGRGAKPEDRANEPEQIRWYGGTVNCLEYNVNLSPNIYWAWVGRVAIYRGLSLGVVVRSDVATRCRVRMAGA